MANVNDTLKQSAEEWLVSIGLYPPSKQNTAEYDAVFSTLTEAIDSYDYETGEDTPTLEEQRATFAITVADEILDAVKYVRNVVARQSNVLEGIKEHTK